MQFAQRWSLDSAVLFPCIGYLLHPPLVLGLQAGILMSDGFFGVLKVSLNDRFWGNALFVSG